MRARGPEAGWRAVIALACVTSLVSGCDETPTDPAANVPIQSDFGSKIVYGTSRTLDVELLRRHCSRLAGTFNECGTICAPDVAVCATVCAFTCENIPR